MIRGQHAPDMSRDDGSGSGWFDDLAGSMAQRLKGMLDDDRVMGLAASIDAAHSTAAAEMRAKSAHRADEATQQQILSTLDPRYYTPEFDAVHDLLSKMPVILPEDVRAEAGVTYFLKPCPVLIVVVPWSVFAKQNE